MKRICKKCNEEKEIENFYAQGKYFKYECKECFNAARRTGKPNTGRFKKGHNGGKRFVKGQVSIFKGKKHTEESIQKMKDALKGRIVWNKGKKWSNPIRRTKTRMGYYSREWVRKVKERDGNKCVECSSTYRIAAHHIKSWKNFPDLRFDINNGKTLCCICHVKIDGFKKGSTINKGRKKTPEMIEKCRQARLGTKLINGHYVKV